jgi:hypothetical protein
MFLFNRLKTASVPYVPIVPIVPRRSSGFDNWNVWNDLNGWNETLSYALPMDRHKGENLCSVEDVVD